MANITALTGPTQIFAQGIYESSTVALHQIGEYAMTNDGRGYRYCKADGLQVVGKLYQARAEDTSNEQELAITNATAGDLSIVTTSTVTLAADLLAGGFLVVSEGTLGVGQMYKIKGNTAASAAVTTFSLEEPVRVTTTGSCKVDVKVNPWMDVVVAPTTATSGPVGAAQYAIPDNSFGWIQTHGIAAVLAQGTVVVGDDIVPAETTTTGTIVSRADASLSATVGFALHGAASTDFALVFLKID